jgi:regulator of sirC expression with transglutaminase-like and TPR domain
MEALKRALAGAADRLDVPALDLASIEFPDLDARQYLDRLDHMAAEIGDATQGASGAEFIARANEYLFEDIGFRGNETDYYDPKNSCFNWVLDQRTGIPITLSLVYIEVARRLQRPVAGIGLPGHFVVRYDDGSWSTYLDPFNGGKLLTHDDCLELVREIAGAGVASEPDILRPVGPQYILTRMLNNLRAAYFRREQFDRAQSVLDILIESSPRTAEYYKARAIARFHGRQFRAARIDFEHYLTFDPQASDREEVIKQMAAIHRYLGALN